MRTLLCITVALLGSAGQTPATPELDKLEAAIKEVMPQKGWAVAKDWHSITLTTTNVRFLNPISLPGPTTDDEIWDQFSFTSDYRITILLRAKLTDAEYQTLARMKKKLTADRMAKVKGSGRDRYGTAKAAEDLLLLPRLHLGRYSVYVYASDVDFFLLRPIAIRSVRERILDALVQNCTSYEAEQDVGLDAE